MVILQKQGGSFTDAEALYIFEWRTRGSFNLTDLDCARPTNTRKRKRPVSPEGRVKSIKIPLTGVNVPELSFPKSIYHGHITPLRYKETEEKARSKPQAPEADTDSFLEAELTGFSIYRAHKASSTNKSKTLWETPLANELASLHEISEGLVERLYFDGIISYGDHRRYVQRVPFSLLSIGGYEEIDRDTVGSDIWIQSVEGRKSNIWYRLGTPTAEYRRYHNPFLWMADLAKHVIDFLHVKHQVSLTDFREDFYEWLHGRKTTGNSIGLWLKQYGDKDFRRIVAAQSNFLYCQAEQVDNAYAIQPLWAETFPWDLCEIPQQVETFKSPGLFVEAKDGSEFIRRRKTTVTPYVYSCFQHLPWGRFLYNQSITVAHPQLNGIAQYRARIASGDAKNTSIYSTLSNNTLNAISCANKNVRIGDVVAIPIDQGGAWKTQDTEYFGYVQKITTTKHGEVLGLLWLYRPTDTTCLTMLYPFPQELFLSDHCNCGDPPIYAHDVVRKSRVAFFGQPQSHDGEFFCRQLYVEGDSAWITLQDSHFRCRCDVLLHTPLYCPGETWLVKKSSPSAGPRLEPVIIAQVDPDGTGKNTQVRKLLRKGRDYGCLEAEPNELVLTDQFDIVSVSALQRRCHVRFFTVDELVQGLIPVPYNRKGTADFYYITSQASNELDSQLEPLKSPWPAYLKEGWDPLQPSLHPPMRGLDMFCGGGNFGRGLEECGAVDFEWAFDWNNEAIHTYLANSKNRNVAKLFRGSVNCYLSQALQGKGQDLVAQPGEVDVIAAGSSCKGFSSANPHKGNDDGLFNESMVASVISFIDLYRPKYALLENVKGMAGGEEKNNVLAQVVCTLVGMGYQLRTFVLDAWSFGSPQSRSRVFVSAAAPGLMPLLEPFQTHSHPESVIGGSLGKTANGLRTAARYTSPTPFKYVTSEEATQDLPATDGRILCIPHPGHRMSRNMSTLNRIRMSCIPRFPGGGTFISACKRGYMPQPQIDSFSMTNKIRNRENSRSWQRVKRNTLMPTVTTAVRPEDGVGGTVVHWDEHRLLTIMEVRRGQGFPDEEVILGSVAEQWKIIGNSVARPVALALVNTGALMEEPISSVEDRNPTKSPTYLKAVVQVLKDSFRNALAPDVLTAVKTEISDSDAESNETPGSDRLPTRTLTRETTTSELTVTKSTKTASM